MLYFAPRTSRGQAGRLWAGKFEYLSARLLPSVVLNISKNPEIPFLLLCLRNLLALLITPLMLVGSRRPHECVWNHTGRQGDASSCHRERRKDGVGNVAVGAVRVDAKDGGKCSHGCAGE